MGIDPEMSAFLVGMEYPATKDDLVREAARDGLSTKARMALDALPDGGFSDPFAIRRALAAVDAAAATVGRELVAA